MNRQATGYVLRGGSFNNNRHNAAASYRNNNHPDNRNNNCGVRVVVSPITFLPSTGRHKLPVSNSGA